MRDGTWNGMGKRTQCVTESVTKRETERVLNEGCSNYEEHNTDEGRYTHKLKKRALLATPLFLIIVCR